MVGDGWGGSTLKKRHVKGRLQVMDTCVGFYGLRILGAIIEDVWGLWWLGRAMRVLEGYMSIALYGRVNAN